MNINMSKEEFLNENQQQQMHVTGRRDVEQQQPTAKSEQTAAQPQQQSIQRQSMLLSMLMASTTPCPTRTLTDSTPTMQQPSATKLQSLMQQAVKDAVRTDVKAEFFVLKDFKKEEPD